MKRILTASTPSRRGISLVELVVTMGFASIVLGTGIGTLHLLLRTDKTLTDSVWRSQSVSNLSRAFRGDVHAARNITTEQPQDNSGPGAFVLELAEGHVVRYTIDKHTLVRKETQADKTLQEERFRFPPGTVISFKAVEPTTAALIIQSIHPSTKERRQTPANVPLRELRIEAVKGRDHRWSSAAPEAAEETP
jgi:hypothetical protein